MSGGAVLTRMLHAIDDLDWATVRGCLGDRVLTDYTELFGGEAEQVTGDELVARWTALLPGFAATQHLTGPVLAEPGPGATTLLRTHVRAVHHLVEPEPATWAVYGHYRADVDGAGRITALTLEVHLQDGDPGLVTTATERAGTAPRTPRAR